MTCQKSVHRSTTTSRTPCAGANVLNNHILCFGTAQNMYTTNVLLEFHLVRPNVVLVNSAMSLVDQHVVGVKTDSTLYSYCAPLTTYLDPGFDWHWFLRRQMNLNTCRCTVSTSRASLLPVSTVYQIPGSIVYRFFLYLSPNSFRYRLSFFFAHSAICATLTTVKMSTPQLSPLTRYTPIQEIVSVR